MCDCFGCDTEANKDKIGGVYKLSLRLRGRGRVFQFIVCDGIEVGRWSVSVVLFRFLVWEVRRARRIEGREWGFWGWDAGGGFVLAKVYGEGYKDSHVGDVLCFNEKESDIVWESRTWNATRNVGYHIYMLSPNAIMQYLKMLDLVEAECMVEA